MPSPALTFLADADREEIHRSVLKVLAQTGARFESPRARTALREAGCIVKEDSTVLIPPELVEWALSKLRRNVTLAARDPSHDVVLDGSRTFVASAGICPYVIDSWSGEHREPSLKDLARAILLADALPEIDVCWFSVSPSGDVSMAMADLASLACALSNSGKHIQGQLVRPEDVPVALEMLDVAAPGVKSEQRALFSSLYCPLSPLTHGKDTLEAAMAMAAEAIPIDIYSLALSGGTGPMTLAGTVVQTLAEELSAVVLLKLVREDCPLILVGHAAILDMATSRYAQAAPEAELMNLALLEMIHSYGCPSQSIGLASDAFDAGFQCGFETSAVAMFTWFARPDMMTGLGGLGGGQIFSPAKLVLDAEAVQYLLQLDRGIDVGSDHLATDVIGRVGPGGHYLMEKETLRAMRRGEQWVPKLFRRRSYEQMRTGTADGLALAEEKVQEILSQHSPVPLPPGASEAMDTVLTAAARERSHPGDAT